MPNPSGINLPEGEDLVLNDLGDGFYTIPNAYEGNFEYFDGKTIAINTTEVRPESEEQI